MAWLFYSVIIRVIYSAIILAILFCDNTGYLFCDNIKVFFVFFHAVLFTRIFFKCRRIRFQFLKFSGGIAYLFEVIVAAFLKLIEFTGMPELRNNVAVVEEKQPYAKTNCGNDVFVPEPGRDVVQQFQLQLLMFIDNHYQCQLSYLYCDKVTCIG